MSIVTRNNNSTDANKVSAKVTVPMIMLWLVLVVSIPGLTISMVSPAFDHLDARGILSAATTFTGYWAAWVPLNAIAWFIMLPGRGILRRPSNPSLGYLRLLGMIVITAYWISLVLMWCFLVYFDEMILPA